MIPTFDPSQPRGVATTLLVLWTILLKRRRTAAFQKSHSSQRANECVKGTYMASQLISWGHIVGITDLSFHGSLHFP
jgi:hypothetical protein